MAACSIRGRAGRPPPARDALLVEDSVQAEKHLGARTDRTKLLKLGLAGRRAVVTYGYVALQGRVGVRT